MCSLGSEPTTFLLLVQRFTHRAPGASGSWMNHISFLTHLVPPEFFLCICLHSHLDLCAPSGLTTATTSGRSRASSSAASVARRHAATRRAPLPRDRQTARPGGSSPALSLTPAPPSHPPAPAESPPCDPTLQPRHHPHQHKSPPLSVGLHTHSTLPL